MKKPRKLSLDERLLMDEEAFRLYGGESTSTVLKEYAGGIILERHLLD